jgi:hypothetical protein
LPYGIPGYKHKHKNNNLLFSLTPLVLYSFFPLPYSFIHLPAIFAPYFSPFPSLSLSHFAACVRSSHCPRVTSCTFSLSSPSFPFLFSLSSSPPLQPAIIFLSHTHSLPSLLYFDSLILSLLSYLSVPLSLHLFFHLLLVHFLAESASYSLLLENFLQFLLSLIPSKPVPVYQYFPVSYFHPFSFTFTPISLSNQSSTPLSIFPLIAPIPVIITLFFLSFFLFVPSFPLSFSSFSSNLPSPTALFLLFLSSPLSLSLILSLAPHSTLSSLLS